LVSRHELRYTLAQDWLRIVAACLDLFGRREWR